MSPQEFDDLKSKSYILFADMASTDDLLVKAQKANELMEILIILSVKPLNNKKAELMALKSLKSEFANYLRNPTNSIYLDMIKTDLQFATSELARLSFQ